MDPGRTERGRPRHGRPLAARPAQADRDGRLFEEVLETLAKSNRERVSARIGTAKKGRIGGCCAGWCGSGAGARSGGALRVGAGAAGRRCRPAAGCGPGGAGKKKSRASGPARVDQVGMSGCSVLAPTGHRGQTSQTGAEEEHGGGLGDNRGLGFNNPTKMGDSLSYKLRV